MIDVKPASEQLSHLLNRGSVVKICGLREPEHAAAATAAGADLLGFIFAPTRRRVSVATAIMCIAAARAEADGRTVVAVGVFVDASPLEIAGIVQESRIDVVQLHGAEPPDSLQNLAVPALKVLRLHTESTMVDVVSEIQSYRSAPVPPVGFQIDGCGGTGTPVDWDLAAKISARCPVLLAGGLNPDNVGAAIRRVRPLGVDVSSGVEVDGVKDVARVTEFVRAARAAFEAR